MRKKYLLDLKQINLKNNLPRIDFHLHTTWTDGMHSVAEMHAEAEKAGLSRVLFSEHARKTSVDWFPRYVAEIKALSPKICQALVGVEVRIEDFSGEINSVPEILKECDLVMASVHRFVGEHGEVLNFDQVEPSQAEAIEFKLAWAALDNPKVDILGHPFGMCFKRYGVIPQEENILRLIQKAARTGVAFEINPYYHPDPWKMIRYCQDAGAVISLGSNAHKTEDVGAVIRKLTSEKDLCQK